jgi:endo-1,4-beta-xylanase
MFAVLLLHGLSSEPLAKGQSKWLGCIIPDTSVPASWDKYWNQVTPENGGKWERAEPRKGVYDWKQADIAYNHAKEKAIPFKYHTFVYGNQEPTWLASCSATEKKTKVLAFMDAVAVRYKPDYIDVCNEVLHHPSNCRDALGGSGTTGWDWVINSFTEARKRFPDSKLLLNEYNIIDGKSIQPFIKVLQILIDKKLVDGAGIQCHEFSMNTISAATINTNLDLLATSSLPVYPSELDARASTESGQADIYKRTFPALWKHKAIRGITLWGYIQGETWVDNTGIVNANGVERQAMTWLKQYLDSADGKV